MSSFLKHLTATLKVFDLIPEFVLVFKALFDNSIGANAKLCNHGCTGAYSSALVQNKGILNVLVL